MKHIHLIRAAGILLLAGLCRPADAQRIGEWQSHLATGNTTAIAESPNQVFALANGTLYSYGKADARVTVHSRQTGLSDTDVKWIGYSSAAKTLLVIYTNGNIDLLSDDGLYNLPFLKNSTTIRDREVYSVAFHNEDAYVAAKFGITVIRLNRKEIAETYRLDRAVYAVCLWQNAIYAATDGGLLRASLSDNLSDAGNWHEQPLNSSAFDGKNIRQMCEFEGMLCMRDQNSGVCYLTPGGEVKTLAARSGLTGMKLLAGRLALHTSTGLFLYESLSRFETVGATTVNDVAGLTNDGTLWLAAGAGGLTGLKRKAENSYETTVSSLNLESPKRNLAQFLMFTDGKLWIAGGGRSKTDRYYNPGTLTVLHNGQWHNYDETQVTLKTGYNCQDYTAVITDPDDGSHFFVATCGDGLLEFKNNEFAQRYDLNNSALQATFPGTGFNRYVRIQGMAYDSQKNLWMTNSEVNNGIVILKSDGTWTSLYYPGVTKAYFVDQILITSRGDKWVNVPHSSNSTGVLVFNDRNTLDNPADDQSHFFTGFKSGSGGMIDATAYYCMAEDRKGEIWIGTNKGPIICPSPGRALENPDNFYCNQIIRTNPANGEPYYFLNGQEVHAIAVDGGNRKWIGTSSSGLYLVTPDGAETVHHFDVNNSPLYSNNILSLAINHETGEVFIGTDKGLISYRAEATASADNFQNIYAWPNPVRPAVDSQVVITGLMTDTSVKITDISGNLIYQGRSAGGQMVWNCRNHSGRIVATGVYIVIVSTPGGESAVTKIAVVQ
ncbi:MAG: T9SS type A sorting domain-containing protein [Tannerella sp.]|jgi:ligand-binding sensor domain-containing protein|nr:T9SS type A sorting domain-containing protein [Tannerella sp.]